MGDSNCILNAMIIGVLIGTYFSLFVASPVMVYLENRHNQKLKEN